MDKKYAKWIILLFALLVIVSAFNVWVVWKLTQLRASEPHLSIPTNFILDYPDCANKLLGSMNISNVRISI